MDKSCTSVTITTQLNKQDWLTINRILIKQTLGKKYRNFLLKWLALSLLASAWFTYTWVEYYKQYEDYFSTHFPWASFF